MAKRAVGTKLQIGANFVAEITSIGGLDLSADTIDVTSLDSDGGYREFIGGFKDAGEVPIQGWFNPGNPGQTAMYDAFQSGTTETFQILFPFGAAWNFKAVVTGFSTSAELEDAVTFEATLKVSGAPTLGLTPSGGLTALSLTGAGGTLSPAFNNSNYNYTFSGVTATSVTITATAAAHSLRLYADGAFVQDLVTGTASNAIPLTLNVGKKLTILAGEPSKTQKVYEVTVVKTT